MIGVLLALNCLTWVAIVWVLRAKYRLVRDSGLVWLGAALVLWPLVSMLVQAGESMLISQLMVGDPVGIYPFSLVAQGTLTLGDLQAALAYMHRLIGGALVLIAVAHLYRNPSAECPTS